MRKLKITELNRISAEEFKQAEKLPLVVVLDDIRSLHNIGSVFRTSDAFRNWNLWGKLNVHPKSFRSVTLKMRFFKHLKRNSPCLMSSMEIFKRKNKD